MIIFDKQKSSFFSKEKKIRSTKIFNIVNLHIKISHSDNKFLRPKKFAFTSNVFSESKNFFQKFKHSTGIYRLF